MKESFGDKLRRWLCKIGIHSIEEWVCRDVTHVYCKHCGLKYQLFNKRW